jgi:hypothetical protein
VLKNKVLRIFMNKILDEQKMCFFTDALLILDGLFISVFIEMERIYYDYVRIYVCTKLGLFV